MATEAGNFLKGLLKFCVVSLRVWREELTLNTYIIKTWF